MPDTPDPIVLPHPLTADVPLGQRVIGEHYSAPGIRIVGPNHEALEDLHVGDFVALLPDNTARRHSP